MRCWLLILLLGIVSLSAEEMMGPSLPEEGLDLPGVAIPAKDWLAYFGPELEGDLIDPQKQLSSLERKARKEFLQQHADDSKIALKVMIFEAGQRLPSDLEALVAPQLSSGVPTALVLYRMGEPGRAKLFFDPDLAAELSATESGRLVGRAALAAEKKVSDLDQFKEFCVQVSIRLYWIEDSLGWVDQPSGEPLVMKPELGEKVSRSERVREAFRGAWEAAGLPLIVAVSAFVCFTVLRLVMRSRRRFRFPEFDVESRLGGEHAAGIGAVISFGSTTQSPSAQKSPTVDCLGGI